MGKESTEKIRAYNRMQRTERANRAFLFWRTRGQFLKTQGNKQKIENTWGKWLRFLKGSNVQRTASAVAIAEPANTVTIHLNNLEKKLIAMNQKVSLLTMIYYRLALAMLQNKALDFHLKHFTEWAIIRASTLVTKGRAARCHALQCL